MKLSFHLAIASWSGTTPQLDTCKDRDIIAWMTDDNISASWSRGGDPDIGRHRSRTASSFLQETSADVLVMVDHDQAWEAGAIERLVETCQKTKAVVSAAISKKSFTAGLASKPTAGHTIEPRTDKVVSSKSLGAGMIAIHREALERLEPATTLVDNFQGGAGYRTYFLPLVAPVEGGSMWCPDDTAFCLRCRSVGVELLIDCLPYVLHIGSYAFSVEDALGATE